MQSRTLCSEVPDVHVEWSAFDGRCVRFIALAAIVLQGLPAAQGLHPPFAGGLAQGRIRVTRHASTLEQPTMLGNLFRGLPKSLIPGNTGRDDRE